MRFRKLSIALGVTASTIVPVAAARAQTFGPLLGVEIPFAINRGRNIGVLDRARPEIQPLGLRAGSFLIYPKSVFGLGYTSNVYGSAADKTDAAVFAVDPSIDVVSQWSRHYLELRADAPIVRYANQPLKKENGYSVGGNGRIDLQGDSNIVASAGYQRGYEQQYSGSFPANAAGSVGYDRTTGLVRATLAATRIRGIASFDVNRLRYSDAETINGVVLDQGYRDRTVYRGSGRVEYALTPDVAAFVQATYTRSAYLAHDKLQPDRSSKEVRALGGFTFDLSNLVRAGLGVGYVHRSYDLAFYPSISGIAADVRLDYFLDPLTTVSFELRRGIEDAITARSPGYTSMQVKLRADHELLRSLLLFVEGSYEHDGYKAVTRTDKQAVTRAGAVYVLNRNVKLGPSLWYVHRASTGEPTGQRFNELRGLVELTTQF